MPEPIELHNDGPFDPEYTANVADFMAECARTLNYCTMSGSGGLEYPDDAEKLIANIYIATGRLPQLFDQLTVFLQSLASSGKLGDAQGRAPALMTGVAGMQLEVARARAHDLTTALQAAQNTISGLYVKENPDA